MRSYQDELRRLAIGSVVAAVVTALFFVYNYEAEPGGTSTWTLAILVIVGILLFTQRVEIIRYVEWVAGFVWSTSAGFLLISILARPVELLRVTLRIHPLPTIVAFVEGLITFGFALWVYAGVRSQVVKEARIRSGKSVKTPFWVFAVAIVFLLGAGYAAYSLNSGSSGESAKSEAEKEYGSQYKYYVSSLTVSQGRTVAHVAVYNSRELRDVTVQVRSAPNHGH